jgi:hypothetical protein
MAAGDDRSPVTDPQAGPLTLLEHQVLIGTAVDIRRGVVAAHLALLNDYGVRVVKTNGDFTRYSHPDTEFFLVPGGAS